jgi:hypothetical protein
MGCKVFVKEVETTITSLPAESPVDFPQKKENNTLDLRLSFNLA